MLRPFWAARTRSLSRTASGRLRMVSVAMRAKWSSAKVLSMTAPGRRWWRLLPLRFVACFRLRVGRVEPRQRHAFLHLAHDPRLQTLLLLGGRCNFGRKPLRDDQRPVAVGDDQIV